MMRPREEFLPRTSQRPSMLVTFWGSTVGKNVVMAVTGAIGVGYLIGHVTGNLLVFLGPAQIDAYAAFLKSKPGLLVGHPRNSSPRSDPAHHRCFSTGQSQPEEPARRL